MLTPQADRLVNVPLAPELGLFLDKAFYDSYNRRWGGDRETLDLDEFAGQVAAFKARACSKVSCPSTARRRFVSGALISADVLTLSETPIALMSCFSLTRVAIIAARSAPPQLPHQC